MLTLASVVAQISMIFSAISILSCNSLLPSKVPCIHESSCNLCSIGSDMYGGKDVWISPGQLERCIIVDDVQSAWIMVLATSEETQYTRSTMSRGTSSLPSRCVLLERRFPA